MQSETVRQTAERVVNRLLDGDTAVQEYSSHEEFEQRPGGPKDPHRQTTVTPHFPRGSFSGKRPGGLRPSMAPSAAPGATPPRSRLNWKPRHESDGGSSEEAGKAWHQGTIPHKTSSQGAVSRASTASKAWHQGKIPHKTSSQGAHSAMGTPGRAWHQGKIPHKTSPQGAHVSMGTPTRAWKPGWERGDKGEQVAGKPGAISYKEALMRQVLENIKVKKAIKGMGKKAPATVARAPGKVSHSKR